jgi:hypothetical protein
MYSAAYSERLCSFSPAVVVVEQPIERFHVAVVYYYYHYCCHHNPKQRRASLSSIDLDRALVLTR